MADGQSFQPVASLSSMAIEADLEPEISLSEFDMIDEADVAAPEAALDGETADVTEEGDGFARTMAGVYTEMKRKKKDKRKKEERKQRLIEANREDGLLPWE